MTSKPTLLTGQSGPLSWTATSQHRQFLARFHAYLDQAFPLPDEKETLSGYRRIWDFLESPQGQEQTRKWSGVEEWVVLLEHQGQVVGGTNFCAIGRQSPGPMTTHGSFWFFLPPFQGKGWSKWLFGVIEQLMGRPFGSNMVLVYEMNDPLGMDAGKLVEDFQATGLHPVDRLAWSHGFDSVVVRDATDAPGGEVATTWVVKEAHQIHFVPTAQPPGTDGPNYGMRRRSP